MSTPQPAGPIDVYARQSRKGDKQKSTPGQVAACRAVLAERGLTPGAVHVDDGKSAWNAKVKRDGWDALMTRLETGAAAGCIVYELSRFSRRPIEGERLIEAAERGLLILDSESEYDLTGANGKKQFRDMLAGAAYYSDDLSRKVKRGKLAKALNGNPEDGGRHLDRAGWQDRPFGWEADCLTQRPAEVAILREMAARVLKRQPQDHIAADLNARGSTTTRGRPWTSSKLKELLLRERNRGNITHLGVVVAQLPGEPVIDSATFDRLAEMYAARRPGRPYTRTYAASGVALCAACRVPLTGRPVARRRPYPDGSVAREYRCLKRLESAACGSVAVDQRALDEAARELVIAILSDPRHAAQVESAAVRHEEEATSLDGLIAEAEETALAIGDRLGRGEMTLARHDAIMGPLDARLAELRAKREVLNGPPARVPAAKSRAQWARRWDAAENGERREMLALALRGRVLMVERPATRNGAPTITIGDAVTP